MNPGATIRDLFYPTEWMFRFFIAAMLIRIVSPQWTYMFPDLSNLFIFPLGYCLLIIAAVGTFVIQVWVGMKYISSRRHNVPLHQ